MSDFNPYAAPLDLGTHPAHSPDMLPWQVAGKALLFRDGARLPEIDLYSGRHDVLVAPASSEFRAGSSVGMVMIRWGGILLLVPLVVFSGSISYSLLVIVFPLGLLAWAILSRWFVAKRFQKARLHWHVASEQDRKRRRRVAWATRGFWLGLVAILVPTFGDFHELQLLGSLFFVVGLITLAVVSRRALLLRCTGERDGWFEIHGIPDHSLRVLAGMHPETARRWIQERGQVRLRKVHTAYLYRFSMSVLLAGSGRSPLIMLIVLIMKLTRARMLVRECFANSEAEDLESADWDPSLRAEWDRIQNSGDFDGWRMLQAQALGSPMGDLLTQWFVITSPDDRISLTIALTRVANARASKEVVETVFRSWTRDGGLLMTGNIPLQKPHPTGCDVKRISGPLLAVRRAHERRMESSDVVSIASPGEWQERLSEEARQRHEALEHAGLLGPTREVGIRDGASMLLS